jgi:hypothetical protein
MVPGPAAASPWAMRGSPAVATTEPLDTEQAPGARRSQVSLRLDPEPPRGTGLLAGGVVSLVAGGALIVGGISVLAANQPTGHQDPDANLGDPSVLGGAVMIVLGVFPTVGGAVMTALGARHRRVWNRWQSRQASSTLGPAVGRTGHGTWTAGLRLAF